jgi:glycosyltransferase involved in cell wall biosynthesis
MRVAVTLETRFQRTPEGSVWTHGLNSYHFWTRYLAVFDGVKVVARVQNVRSASPDWRRVDGPGVEVCPVPFYIGPWQYLARARRVGKAVHSAIGDGDAVLMRVSGQIANCLEPLLARTGRPFGLEVISDPHDLFSKGAVRGPLRPFYQWWFTRRLRRQCRRGAGVAYVTERALQTRYPCAGYSVGMSDVDIPNDALVAGPAVFTTHYSSVELKQSDTEPSHKPSGERRQNFRLITIASLAQVYKGVDVLLAALADCLRAGMDLRLAVVGDGKFRLELELLAQRMNLAGRVSFLGQLPSGPPVRVQLDNSDLFVLPSRCEGLPRAMIEAMARSLPCIGSTVGGIPELLPAEDMVPPGDAGVLALKIREVLGSPARMKRMSERNFAKAQEFRDEVLDARRRAFFGHIRAATEAWLEARNPKMAAITQAAGSCS